MRSAIHQLPLAAIAAAALLLLGACAKQEIPPDPVRPVQLAQVRTDGTGDSALFAGEVKPRHENDLGFRIGGKIVARYVDTGTRVKKGTTLARLDPADVALQAEAAKAALAAAETEYLFAKSEFERYQNLQAQNFVSISALDQKKNAYNSNRAKYEQAKAQLAVTQNQAGYAVLQADADGVITAVNAESGQVVTAGQAVMRLAREDEREVAISVPENRIAEVRNARAIAVSLWANPNRIYAAKVREIAPAVDPVTRTFAVRLAIVDPDAALQWGMTANVALQVPGGADAALVPLASIYQQDGQPAVWMYDPDTRKVALRKVTIGRYREDGAVITAGLRRGEWVVAAGVHKLQPGQVVRPYDAPGMATPSAVGSSPARPAGAATTPG
jgi:multidrug efflux system membrane fusion protein